ncbi:MAG: RNA polymerase sigma factor [Lachnospiraceae bacterium]|nr:RNA polymerase sigma factor [Lachnospiraceae bacterium]
MTNMEWSLVALAKQGDTHAFARLYEKYYTDLYRFALCLLKNPHTAEDAVSGAVLRAYEYLPRLKKNDSFKSWIFQITANECRNLLKRQFSLYLEDSSFQEPVTEETGYITPELEELLNLLSEEERLVVTLAVFTGYNSREIASLLHKKEGTIRSLKSRSLAKLRTHLEKEN